MVSTYAYLLATLGGKYTQRLAQALKRTTNRMLARSDRLEAETPTVEYVDADEEQYQRE